MTATSVTWRTLVFFLKNLETATPVTYFEIKEGSDMANVSNPNITVELTFKEYAVIRTALEGAVGNWYFTDDEERDLASSLLMDFGG